jgi:hypothetical protein
VNTNDVYNRNVDYIRAFIVKYNIEYSFEDLMSMATIYINFDQWTFRVYANLVEQGSDDHLNEDGKVQKNNIKIKKVNFYFYSKRKIDKEFLHKYVLEKREDFIKFVYYYDQLKLIKQLETLENNAGNAKSLAEDSTIRSLKFSEG